MEEKKDNSMRFKEIEEIINDNHEWRIHAKLTEKDDRSHLWGVCQQLIGIVTEQEAIITKLQEDVETLKRRSKGGRAMR